MKKAGLRKNVENETEKQRKKYEETHQQKKDLLRFEFEKQEEISKYDQLSVQTSNEIKFKSLLNQVQIYTTSRQSALQEMFSELDELSRLNELTQPLNPLKNTMSTSNNFNVDSQTLANMNLTSSIFSKRQYRPDAVEFLTERKQKNRQQLLDYMATVKSKIENVSENIRTEEERQAAISSQYDTIFLSKQKMQSDVTDLETLNHVADRRFQNLEAIRFQAQEKKQDTVKSLWQSKQEVNQMVDNQYDFVQQQKEKLRKEKRNIADIEEYTSHTMYKIDVTYKQNEKLLKQIDQEIQKEKKIIRKRMESKYIIKYIEYFQFFENLFMQDKIDDQIIQKIYEAENPEEMQPQEKRSNSPRQRRGSSPNHRSQSPTLSAASSEKKRMSMIVDRKTINPIEIGGFTQAVASANNQVTFSNKVQQQQEINRPVPQIRLPTRKTDQSSAQTTNQSQQDYNLGTAEILNPQIKRSSITKPNSPQHQGNSKGGVYTDEGIPPGDDDMQQQEDFDRTELIDKINEFYGNHIDGPTRILEFTINFYRDQTYMKERLNEKYKDLLNVKKKYQQQLEDIKQQFEELMNKNKYIQEMENDQKLEEQHQITKESLDSGIIQLAGALQTVNIVNFDLNDQDKVNDIIMQLTYLNQNFAFRFIQNYSDSIVRLSNIMLKVYNYSQNLCPYEINSKCQEIISFVKTLFSSKNIASGSVQFQSSSRSRISRDTNAKMIPLPPDANKGNRLSVMPMQQEEQQIMPLGTSSSAQRRKSSFSVMKQIQDQFNLDQIVTIFMEDIKASEEEAEQFGLLVRQYRLITFFCSAEQLHEYLQEQKKQSNTKHLVRNCFDNIRQLESKAIQNFEKKVKNLVEFFSYLIHITSEQSRGLYKTVKHLNPYFDPKIVNIKMIKNSRYIEDINKQVIDKIDNYRRNQDPNNNDDFVILRREENQQKANSDKPQMGLLTEMAQSEAAQAAAEQSNQIKKIQQQPNQQELEQAQQKEKLNQLMEFVLNSQIKESIIASARTTEKANYLAAKEGTGNGAGGENDEQQQMKDMSEEELMQLERAKLKQRHEERLKEYLKREETKKNTKVLSKQAQNIQEIDKRLYEEPGNTAKLLHNFAYSSTVLSKIDRLDRQSENKGKIIKGQILQKKDDLESLIKAEQHAENPVKPEFKVNQLYVLRKQQSEEHRRFLAASKIESQPDFIFKQQMLKQQQRQQQLTTSRDYSKSGNIYSYNYNNLSKGNGVGAETMKNSDMYFNNNNGSPDISASTSQLQQQNNIYKIKKQSIDQCYRSAQPSTHQQRESEDDDFIPKMSKRNNADMLQMNSSRPTTVTMHSRNGKSWSIQSSLYNQNQMFYSKYIVNSNSDAFDYQSGDLAQLFSSQQTQRQAQMHSARGFSTYENGDTQKRKPKQGKAAQKDEFMIRAKSRDDQPLSVQVNSGGGNVGVSGGTFGPNNKFSSSQNFNDFPFFSVNANNNGGEGGGGQSSNIASSNPSRIIINAGKQSKKDSSSTQETPINQISTERPGILVEQRQDEF